MDVAADRKPAWSIRTALEWAIGSEGAAPSASGRVRDLSGKGWSGAGPEARIMDQAFMRDGQIGGTQIDQSRGESFAHDDAYRLASALLNACDGQTVRVVELYAKIMAEPDWMPGARPKIHPVKWKPRPMSSPCQTAMVGRHEKIRVEVVREKVLRRQKPRRWVTRQRRVDVMWCPCEWDPTLQEIEAAREEYDRWWSGLNRALAMLDGEGFERFDLTDRLPPYQPWRR